MRTYNFITGIIFLGVAILIIRESIHLGLGELTYPGAGFFPILSALPLALLAGILIWSSIRKRGDEEKVKWPASKNTRKIIFVLVTLLLYGSVLNRLGYFVTTFFCLLFLFKIEPQRWIVAISLAALTVILTYVVFAVFLEVPLPSGIIPWSSV